VTDEFAQLVKATGAERADGTPFPIRAPEGWVHLSVAAAKLLAAWMPKEGTWRDAFPPVLGLASTAPTDSEDDWGQHIARSLAQAVASAAYEGHLLTGYRPIQGGSVTPMPAEWWDTEDIFLRFRTWSVDPTPGNEFSDRLDLPCWIWVEATSLDEQCRRVVTADGREPLPRVTLMENFHPISLVEALAILGPLRHDDAAIPTLGAPAGAAYLKDLCASSVVRSVAGQMFRSINADRRGVGGKTVESVANWAIPPRVWEALVLSPVQNWLAGEIVSCPDERISYRLHGVVVDKAGLMKSLEAQGLAGRVQWRIRGAETVFAEGIGTLPTLAAIQAQGAPPPKRGGRKPVWDWDRFEAAAARILDEEGDYSDGFRQGHLERRMEDWCTKHFETQPGESSIREHVKRAHALFVQSRRGQ
jgi:hypothetical protein